MPITIREEEGNDVVCIVCDYCRKDIEDVKQGNVYWPANLGGNRQDARPLYLHKHCSFSFERSQSDEILWKSFEMRDFLFYLRNTVRPRARQ